MRGTTNRKIRQMVCAECPVAGAPQEAASPAPYVEAKADTADAGGTGAFGAFAIDETAWAFGFGVLYPSPAEANRGALARCAQEGGGGGARVRDKISIQW